MGMDFGFFGLMFAIVPIMVILVFALVFGLIIVSLVRGGKEWNRNNNSPVLTVPAKVVAKRMAVSRHTHHNEHMNTHHNSSSYYTTFEVESGDRIELLIPDAEYGFLVEGDKGRLTFQGTRYKGFERDKPLISNN